MWHSKSIVPTGPTLLNEQTRNILSSTSFHSFDLELKLSTKTASLHHVSAVIFPRCLPVSHKKNITTISDTVSHFHNQIYLIDGHMQPDTLKSILNDDLKEYYYTINNLSTVKVQKSHDGLDRP
jgi:hypothetical protein